MTTHQEAIIIQNLTKHFDLITAVNNLNLTVHSGEMFGLVGPDGAGKTTTIRMLCGVLSPTSGTASILGNDLVKHVDRIKRDIGYLSQRFSLYGDLTVNENIEFFAEIHEVGNYENRREQLLEFTRLTHFRNRLADTLSGGMKQKLALACTLIHTPKILLLDEPTTGVDPVSRREFWKILSSLLKSNITIIMSTPYLDEAERCTRVGLIHQGTLMVVDAPANVKKMMMGEVVEIVPQGNIRAAAAALKTSGLVREVQAFGDRLNVVVDNSTEAVPHIETYLRQAGLPIAEWRVITPSLENVFISLMSHQQHQEVLS